MEDLMRSAVQLAGSLDALAALAAYLRVEREELPASDEIRSLLHAIAIEVAGDDVQPGPSADAIVGMTRAFLQQAVDLVDNPDRAGAWDQADEPLLNGLGRLSMAIVDAFRVATNELEGLAAALEAPGGRFLDVGTGTGWLAIATASAFPSVHIVGIDIFEPALALARRNVADAGLTDRIELRAQDGARLAAEASFDAIWLPLPFMPPDTVRAAVEASAGALRPGGWLLGGTFAGSGDRLSELLVELRTARSGGRAWTRAQLVEMYASASLVDADELVRTWSAPVRLFVARRAER
jgi:SAM-dependent methyltransferase